MAATLRGMLLKGQVWVDPDGSTAVPTASDMAGFCDKGSVLVDGGNGALYVNTGTPAAPVWTAQQLFTGAPTASASLSFLRLGNADITAGNSSGTFIGINADSGYGGNFVDFQIAGTRKFQITGDGYVGIGTAPTTANALRILTFSSVTTSGQWLELVYSGASSFIGGRFYAYNASASNIETYGIQGFAYYRGTGGTVANTYGGAFSVQLDGSATLQTLTDAVGVYCPATVNSQTGTTTMTRRSGVLIENQGAGSGSGGLTVTSAYGIAIRQQTTAATNYCFVTLDASNVAQLAIDGNGRDFILDATTGTKFGTATTQKLSFYNATPIVRPGAYTQTYATADKTHANPTATALTAATGTADGTVDDVGAAFNQTTLNNNFKEMATGINALIVDLADAKQLCNSIIDDLQALGLAG